jgi:hypothetical protein
MEYDTFGINLNFEILFTEKKFRFSEIYSTIIIQIYNVNKWML